MSLFAFSLPFNGVEWDVLGISRFEIKITMITFMLLFAVWVIVIQKNGVNYEKYEIIIFSFMFIYICTQYISIINSKFIIESIQQSIIITCFAIMMLVSSQLIAGRQIAHYVIISMGFTCIIFSIILFIMYFYFSDAVRLGQAGSNRSLNVIFRGDPSYFGDIVIYGLGPFYYTIFSLCRNKLSLILAIPFQIIIFLVISNTYTKGVILSVLIFFFFSILFLKGRRIFMMLSCILFTTILLINFSINLREIIRFQIVYDYLSVPTCQNNFKVTKTYFPGAKWAFCNHYKQKDFVKDEEMTVDSYLERFFKSRLNILGALGRTSLDIRLKAINVALINSLPNIWFGHGAGTSQKLLPAMAVEYDKQMAVIKLMKIAKKQKKHDGVQYSYFTGDSFEKGLALEVIDDVKNNRTVVDTHNMLLTELFNVGVIGALSLFIMIILILYEQIKVIRINKNKNNFMNELLFLTLFSMLVHRLTDSLIALPFLWFMLGINLGLIKLQLEKR